MEEVARVLQNYELHKAREREREREKGVRENRDRKRARKKEGAKKNGRTREVCQELQHTKMAMMKFELL